MVQKTAPAAMERIALFGGLPAVDREVLFGHLQQREFARGQIIFSQGDPGDGLYILTRGHVTISRRAPDGGELILALCQPGEHFGELALFDDEPRSADATAAERSSALFLARSAFRSFLEGNPAAVLLCLESVVRQLRRCTDLVDEIALLDVRGRLASRLLKLEELAPENGVPRGRPFRVTQQQLASMIGATRESVNKHLAAFIDEGAVTLGSNGIEIVDHAALREYSAKFE